ncbi:MAG: DNA-3-methyladenine glycosylase family protein [Thermomicrobiales bacterium]
MRTLDVLPPFDLARTVAPAWWARGRWPNVDYADGCFLWVGWEGGVVVWRSVRQLDRQTLVISGSARAALDRSWAARVLGSEALMPGFDDPALVTLASTHSGMKPWANGSLFEGVVSSIVGQSISVAAAATTERRLYALFNEAVELNDRQFWPPPKPPQLAAADPALVRSSGVTTTRANALVEVGAGFVSGRLLDVDDNLFDPVREGRNLLAITGVGPWTARSAFLWGIGDADAHPTGDVALLRAARRHHPHVSTLKDLDLCAERWKPNRAWAARLLWLDMLGFAGSDSVHEPVADPHTTYP